FFTRFFKHAPFDIIVASSLFVFLLGVSVITGIGILLYMYSSIYTLDSERENKMHKALLNIFDLISVVPMFMVIISLSNTFVVSPATVIGQSMEPTFYEGQDILMTHFTNNYERFDVIVLETEGGDFYLKRIIGLPGDNIKIDHNVISINGVEIEQEFLENEFGSIDVYTYCNTSHLQVCEFDVPLDSYFVLGDNRERSLDSRSDQLGYVNEDQLYGTVVFKFNNIFRDVLNQE
ncbi:MAG: signal peptidase I, partial [Candidatus Izimaplasma sp.]|nr:signal peptidase I [Candidatus Izimaplasma bacterium]